MKKHLEIKRYKFYSALTRTFLVSRQKLVETKNEQVKNLMVDIDQQVREVSERAWKHILETVIYHCDPDETELISSEFDREVDSHYYSIKAKFEKVSELLKE